MYAEEYRELIFRELAEENTARDIGQVALCDLQVDSKGAN